MSTTFGENVRKIMSLYDAEHDYDQGLAPVTHVDKILLEMIASLKYEIIELKVEIIELKSKMVQG